MCGICGAAWRDPANALTHDQITGMIAQLSHRGPDDQGLEMFPHAALGFRRLSILDLAGAHQPLANEDRSVWTVFNGEIYNFPSLRRRLEARGHTLRSQGDSEVLVHLYEDEGVNLFSLLRGMFALAIWDVKKQRLVLGRDRMGQKPLAYAFTDQRLIFASELKSLLSLPQEIIPRDADPRALDRYLTYGYIPHPMTIFRGVHKLPPAHYAVWERGQLTMDRYWEPDWNDEQFGAFSTESERLSALLHDAVREQMVSDVPLGAFLSGGIDSTSVVGMMQKFSTQPVKTFAIGFADPAFDESGYAREAAKTLGTDHQERILEPDSWRLLPDLAITYDEPFADSSALPTYELSRWSRTQVTVALTGDGGDELFGGYDRYRALRIADAMNRLPAYVRRFLAGPLARTIPASARAKTRLRRWKRFLEVQGEPLDMRYLRWCGLFSESERMGIYTEEWLDALGADALREPTEADPTSVLFRAMSVAPRRDPTSRAMIADMLGYLPDDLLHKVDMASMAAGLECRSPFLDHRVVEFALKMPVRYKLAWLGGGKAILKSACRAYLPAAIRRRKKMGFGVPLDRWFRGPLKERLRSVLLDNQCRERGIFQPDAVAQMIEDHQTGAKDHAYRLWALLILELWFQQYGGRAPLPTETRP